MAMARCVGPYLLQLLQVHLVVVLDQGHLGGVVAAVHQLTQEGGALAARRWRSRDPRPTGGSGEGRSNEAQVR